MRTCIIIMTDQWPLNCHKHELCPLSLAVLSERYNFLSVLPTSEQSCPHCPVNHAHSGRREEQSHSQHGSSVPAVIKQTNSCHCRQNMKVEHEHEGRT